MLTKTGNGCTGLISRLEF